MIKVPIVAYASKSIVKLYSFLEKYKGKEVIIYVNKGWHYNTDDSRFHEILGELITILGSSTCWKAHIEVRTTNIQIKSSTDNLLDNFYVAGDKEEQLVWANHFMKLLLENWNIAFEIEGEKFNNGCCDELWVLNTSDFCLNICTHD